MIALQYKVDSWSEANHQNNEIQLEHNINNSETQCKQLMRLDVCHFTVLVVTGAILTSTLTDRDYLYTILYEADRKTSLVCGRPSEYLILIYIH